MDRPHSALLRRKRGDLIEAINLRYSPLWDLLLAKEVITRQAVDKIKTAFRSNKEQVGEFLDYLGTRPHKDYLVFREALIDAKQAHVVEELLQEEQARIPVFSLPHVPEPASAKSITDIKRRIRNLPPATNYKICKQTFKRNKEKTELCYPMPHEARGRALVITMTGDREGWEEDVIKIAQLFKYLDLEAHFHYDLKYDEFVRALDDFAKSKENNHVDCAWVVIMGHGSKRNGEDFLATRDAMTFFIRKEMERAFDNKRCIGLQRKPKVVLVQMCRGEESDVAISPSDITDSDTKERSDMEADANPQSHSAANAKQQRLAPFEDYLISYATQPGKQALRNTVRGSWYIEKLVEVFMDMADHVAVPDMLEEVHRRVRDMVCTDEQGRDIVQTAEATLSFSRRFYLFPRVHEDTESQPSQTDDEPGVIDTNEETSDREAASAQVTTPMTKEELEELRTVYALMKQREDDEVEVTFKRGTGRLKITSNDKSTDIKRPVSVRKLRAVTDSTLPTQVRHIAADRVNLGMCCTELFTFASTCINCAIIWVEKIKDNTPSNSDIISGLEAALSHLTELRRVNICSTPLGASGGRVLAAFRTPHMRVLRLSHNQLGGCGPHLTACLQALPALGYLNLNDSGLSGEEMPGVLSGLATSCPRLVALLLGGNNLSQAAAPLAQAAHKLKLKVLGLDIGKLRSNQIGAIVRNTPACIEYLALDRNAVCTEGENELISVVKQRPKLWYLTLDRTQVSASAWRRMESMLQARGGCLYENLDGSEGRKRGVAFLGKISDECFDE